MKETDYHKNVYALTEMLLRNASHCYGLNFEIINKMAIESKNRSKNIVELNDFSLHVDSNDLIEVDGFFVHPFSEKGIFVFDESIGGVVRFYLKDGESMQSFKEEIMSIIHKKS